MLYPTIEQLLKSCEAKTYNKTASGLIEIRMKSGIYAYYRWKEEAGSYIFTGSTLSPLELSC